MPEGEPRDRVGTLIRNKNLESNFLTLGIRFQFKVPHLGEGLACVASIPVRFCERKTQKFIKIGERTSFGHAKNTQERSLRRLGKVLS